MSSKQAFRQNFGAAELAWISGARCPSRNLHLKVRREAAGWKRTYPPALFLAIDLIADLVEVKSPLPVLGCRQGRVNMDAAICLEYLQAWNIADLELNQSQGKAHRKHGKH